MSFLWRSWDPLDQAIKLNITSENQMDSACHPGGVLSKDSASFLHCPPGDAETESHAAATTGAVFFRNAHVTTSLN